MGGYTHGMKLILDGKRLLRAKHGYTRRTYALQEQARHYNKRLMVVLVLVLLCGWCKYGCMVKERMEGRRLCLLPFKHR